MIAVNPWGPIARSSIGKRSSCFQTHRPRRGDPADAIAFLDQSEPEVIGLDRQVSKLYQAQVESRDRVAPEVAEEDVTVGGGGQPARGGPENPADASQVGALPQLSCRLVVEELETMGAGEQGDCGRVVDDGQDSGFRLLFGLDNRDQPVGAAYGAGGAAARLAGGRGGTGWGRGGRALAVAAEEVEPDDFAG